MLGTTVVNALQPYVLMKKMDEDTMRRLEEHARIRVAQFMQRVSVDLETLDEPFCEDQ